MRITRDFTFAMKVSPDLLFGATGGPIPGVSIPQYANIFGADGDNDDEMWWPMERCEVDFVITKSQAAQLAGFGPALMYRLMFAFMLIGVLCFTVTVVTSFGYIGFFRFFGTEDTVQSPRKSGSSAGKIAPMTVSDV